MDSRFPVTEALKEQLGAYAGSRAWTIAGVTQLDIVLQVYESLRTAIETGQSLDEWKAGIKDKLEQSWGKKDSARLETIFRTNVQTAYNRGRYLQMKDLAVTAVRPFWMYDAILDSRTTQVCKDLNKTVLPQDDPFWDARIPPLHFACRSSIRSLTEAQAKRRGVTQKPPTTEPGEGFGAAPIADDWKPDPEKYPPELWRIFEDKQKER